MLHKCANPECSRSFRNLAEGKLFLIETNGTAPALRGWDGPAARRVEHFWLCELCASVLTLSFDKGRGMVTVPLPEAVRKGPKGASREASIPVQTITTRQPALRHA